MTAERWRKIEEVFHQALEREYSKRTPFLDEACAGDLALRREVESLLASAEEAKAGSFLNAPALVANNRPLWSLDQLVGQTIDEKYRVDKKLGQGGMGAVYLATHLGTGRPVAIKVIAPQFMANEEFVERFKREAKAAGLLRHPNVVNVTDFGFSHIGSDKLAYLVMEYLDGCNLGDMLKKKGKLPLGFVVDIVEQVCLAMDEAHKQGIIHRDLKPDNIWLEPNGRGGYNVKVLDFGLAKLRETAPFGVGSKSEVAGATTQTTLPFAEINSDALSAATTMEREVNLSAPTQIRFTSNTNYEKTEIDEEKTEVINRGATAGTIDPRTIPEWLTRVGTVLGTPLYMSPEQCHGGKLDARSDIYSLGVIVYQMLTGETPFTGDMYQLISKHSDMPPPPLREKRRDIPKAVAALAMSALAKNPADRPPTAMAFATALRANAEGEAPILREASDLYRKHFSTLIRISACIYFPFIFLNPLLLLGIALMPLETMPSLLVHLIHKGYWLFLLLIILFANAVNTAACALVIEKLRLAPLSPVEMHPIFATLKKHLLALAITAVRSYLTIFVKLLKLIIPGMRAYIDYSLYAPVVMMEGADGSLALTRSKALVDRLRALAIPIQIRDLFIGSMALLAFPLTFALCSLLPLRLEAQGFAGITELFVIFFPAVFIISVHPFIAIALAILYFKTRQAGGETLNETLSQELELKDRLRRQLIPHKRTVVLLATLLVALIGWIKIQGGVLGFAARHGDTVIVKALLALGVDVNTKDWLVLGETPLRLVLGETPLIAAASNRQTDIMKLLLDKGADVNARTVGGETALTLASSWRAGSTDIMKLLLDKGADVNAKGFYGETALTEAATFSRVDAIKLLLERGADVNARDNGGETALMYVSTHQQQKRAVDVVKFLLDKGADVNVKDSNGRTALMHAVTSNYSEHSAEIKRDIIKTLLAASADVNTKDNSGKTALMLAAESGQQDIAELLKAAGAAQ